MGKATFIILLIAVSLTTCRPAKTEESQTAGDNPDTAMTEDAQAETSGGQQGDVQYPKEINIVVCTFISAGLDSCPHRVFSCGDFGTAYIQLEGESQDLWTVLANVLHKGSLEVNVQDL